MIFNKSKTHKVVEEELNIWEILVKFKDANSAMI